MSDEPTTEVYDFTEPTGAHERRGTEPSGPDVMQGRLVVLEGAEQGRQWPLGAQTTIGRTLRGDVTIEDALVSREHCVVSRDAGGWMVRDLGSRNGTWLNGRMIDVERLGVGDRLTFGQTVLLFAHVDPLHERLIERQKIEALGRLGAGVAHDLNNYFGAILGAIDLLEGMPAEQSLSDPEVRESLADVRAATRRGAELTQRLLGFARRGGEDPTTIEVAQLCEEAAEIARRAFDRSVRIEIALAPGLSIRGDRGRLYQVLMNLLVNARDAMPRGGTLTVRAEALAAENAGTPGPRVRIAVSDTGAGMTPATRARIFEPFFTTKAPEKGTGLGLAIASDVVSSHGGTIECDSELGRGTEFRILLPASEAVAARREARTPYRSFAPRRPDGQTGAVLVVDDEPMVRRAMRRLLERDGLRVIEAVDGQSAIEIVREKAADIGVVLMDLDMPELDGEGACRAMHMIDPSLPVVILSGLCDDPRRRRLDEAGARAVLQKPCDGATLRSTIHDAMDVRMR